MGLFRQLAFYFGLAVGMLTVAVAGTVLLTYLFTGKFPAVEMKGEKPQVALMTPDQVVGFVRAQVDRAREAQAAQVAAGEEGM
ncbi:MAG: hypothetical protein JXA93_15425 [Anaerolineae bacterium]|nr:hypothetical protein [Anaerolineae bacterium]